MTGPQWFLAAAPTLVAQSGIGRGCGLKETIGTVLPF